MAVYFPDGEKPFSAIVKKFAEDLDGIKRNDAVGMAFVTNQQISLGERDLLHEIDHSVKIEIYHIERVREFLDTPRNRELRREFLSLPADAATKEEIGKHFSDLNQTLTNNHSETLAAISRRVTPPIDIESLLSRLPPAVSQRAREALPTFARLTDILRKLVSDRTSVAFIHDLLQNQPPWLRAAPIEVLEVLVESVIQYGSTSQVNAALGTMVENSVASRTYWEARALFNQYIDSLRANEHVRVTQHETTYQHPIAAAIYHLEEGDFTKATDCLRDWDCSAEPDVALRIILEAQALIGEDGDGTNRAIEFLSNSLTTTESSYVRLVLAKFLIRRAYLRETDTPEADYNRAIDLALRSRDRLREWKGESWAAVDLALTAAVMRRDWFTIRRLAHLPPAGEALKEEAERPEIQGKAAMAAAAVGRVEEARTLASNASAFDAACVEATLRENSSVTTDELDAGHYWQVAFEEATDRDEQLIAIYGIAISGRMLTQDQSDLAGQNPYANKLVSDAQAVRKHGDESATAYLARLRGESSKNRLAVSKLAEELFEIERQDDAVSVLERGAESFQDETFRLIAAAELISRGEYESASRLAREASSRAAPTWPGRRRAIEILHDAAHLAGEWSNAEGYARLLLEINPDDTTALWGMAMAQSNQGSPERSWRTLTRDGRHPVPTSVDQELFLLRLTSRFGSIAQLWEEALVLAKKYNDNERSLSAVLQIAFSAKLAPANVDDDSNEPDDTDLSDANLIELQALLESFFERFPNSETGFRRVALNEDDLLGSFDTHTRSAQERAEALEEFSGDDYPLGTACIITGCRYGEAVVSRVRPHLWVSSADLSEANQDRDAAARAASDSIEVLVELGSLDVLVRLGRIALPSRLLSLEGSVALPAELRDRLFGIFPGGLCIHDYGLQDAYSTREMVNLRGNAALQYDPEVGRTVLSRLPEVELQNIRERAAGLFDVARQLRNVPTRYVDDRASSATRVAWLGAVETARATDRALWSDDVSLRRFARSLGIVTFGTVDVVNLSRTTGTVSEDELVDLKMGLFLSGAVDLDITPETVIAGAAFQNWTAGNASLYLTRPASWARSAEACVEILLLAIEQNATSPGDVVTWCHRAGIGLLGAVTDYNAPTALSVLIRRILLRDQTSPTTLGCLMTGLTYAADELVLASAWREAISGALPVLEQIIDPSGARRLLLTLVSSCEDSFRRAAVMELLRP